MGMKKNRKFTAHERELLANYLASGVSKSECAGRLGRDRRTIQREIAANGSWVKNQYGKKIFVYTAITAQAKRRRKQLNSAFNKHPLKNPDVYVYVTEKLRGGWSPEQISGRLKEIDHKDDHHWQISHETIYKWIFDQPTDPKTGLHWYEYLRRKQKKRKRQKGRTVHSSHIPDRVSISQRPQAVNNRTEFGHWEGDSIEGRRKEKDSLHTEVERITRKIKAVKVNALTSEEALRAQKKIFKEEPKQAVKSTTLDNGRENHLHYKLRTKFNMATYHAHPYSSFERGTNENGNLWIRYYFPKGTDFAQVTNQELQAVVNEINNRPRKIHGFQTANEVYYQLLKKTTGAAIVT